MACGRPVIVSEKAGCAPDLVREGENGSVIAGGNPEGAVALIKASLADEGLLSGMGARSRVLIEPFNNGRFVSAVREILGKIDENKG
jgi:glycosyltransferase involved in cell wall biosynthesis